MPLQVLPQQIVQNLHIGYPLLCNIVASTALIVWDTLLTFDEEVVFIRSSNAGTFVKVLYFVVRYVALVIYSGTTFAFVGDHKTFSLCSKIMWPINFAGTFTIACSNILLIQRVYAFYGRSKPLLWFLSFMFSLVVISSIVILAVGVPRFQVVDLQEDLPSSFGHCVIEHYSGIMSFILFLESIFQSIAFACIVARFATLRFTSWKTGVRLPSLYMDFLRDGIWVFVLLFLTFLLSGIYTHTGALQGLSFAVWSYAASSICVSAAMAEYKYRSSPITDVIAVHASDIEPKPFGEL